jgi:hypothetical protein
MSRNPNLELPAPTPRASAPTPTATQETPDGQGRIFAHDNVFENCGTAYVMNGGELVSDGDTLINTPRFLKGKGAKTRVTNLTVKNPKKESK